MIRAKADGTREEYSDTSPHKVETAATLQCKKGGLKAISPP